MAILVLFWLLQTFLTPFPPLFTQRGPAASTFLQRLQRNIGNGDSGFVSLNSDTCLLGVVEQTLFSEALFLHLQTRKISVSQEVLTTR